MIKPESPLPWKFKEDDIEYKIQSGDWAVIMCDRPYENWAPSKEDAKYITVAANQYPILLDFIERLESTTTDKVVAEKIRKLLIEQGLWK